MTHPKDHSTDKRPDLEDRPKDRPESGQKDEQLPKDQAEASTQPSGAEDPGSEVEFMRDSDHMKNKK